MEQLLTGEGSKEIPMHYNVYVEKSYLATAATINKSV